MNELAIKLIEASDKLSAAALRMLKAPVKVAENPGEEGGGVTLEFCQDVLALRNDVAAVLATIDEQLAPCYAPGGPWSNP